MEATNVRLFFLSICKCATCKLVLYTKHPRHGVVLGRHDGLAAIWPCVRARVTREVVGMCSIPKHK